MVLPPALFERRNITVLKHYANLNRVINFEPIGPKYVSMKVTSLPKTRRRRNCWRSIRSLGFSSSATSISSRINPREPKQEFDPEFIKELVLEVAARAENAELKVATKESLKMMITASNTMI